jgi:nucleoside-diphosphate-sugar epimerase
VIRSLVLGGSVFVGKHLVDALVARGDAVAVLNRGRTPSTLPSGVEHLVADRTDAAQLRAVLAGRTWDAVYDVSGFVMAAGGGDIATMIELLNGRTERYVFVSSIMAYDQSLPRTSAWTEDLAANPDDDTTYGGFKAATERQAIAEYHASGFPATVVRPAAIYGPDNNIFDMETPMFLRLLQGRPILVPHGGQVAGSYGHVDDLCAAMMVVANDERACGEVFNVTTTSVDVNGYVAALSEVVGRPANVVYVPDEVLPSITTPVYSHLFGLRHDATLSTAKIRRLVAGRDEYDLVAGHAHTYAWFREQGWHQGVDRLVDPVWRASWNFDAESELAERITRG